MTTSSAQRGSSMTTPYGEVTDEMVRSLLADAMRKHRDEKPFIEARVLPISVAMNAMRAALTVRGIQDDPAAKAALKG